MEHMPTLQIGNVAERTGVSVATIRYYESIGLLPRPARSAAGYRRYTVATVDELCFIRKAQALGFSLEEIAEILKVSRTGQAPCAQVLDLARQHLAAVEQRIRQLHRFRKQLAAEIAKWEGKKQPACDGLCQIIEGASDAAPIEFRSRAPRGGRRSASGRED